MIRSHNGAWQSGGTRDLDVAIRSARRHSRWVRRLRLGVPVAAFGVAAYFTAASALHPHLPNLIGAFGITGTKITMEVPHIAGITRDGRAYRVRAGAAQQDLLNPDALELSEIHAEFTTKDKANVVLSAPSGHYDVKSELLTLFHDVAIESTDGKSARLAEAEIETRSGRIVSRRPVDVTFPGGSLKAKGLEVAGGGDVVRFNGGVRMLLRQSEATRPPGSNVPTGSKVFPGSNISTGSAHPGTTGAIRTASAGPMSALTAPVPHDAAGSDPIEVSAMTLEMHDNDHAATFEGHVHAVDGTTVMDCDRLLVTYAQDDPAAGPKPGDSSGQQIRHLLAKGHVVLKQADKVAEGDAADFDPPANAAVVTGNVTLTQGQNVVHGDRLVTNLATGLSRIDSLPDGHVDSVFQKTSDPAPAH